jgi:SPP1 family predicted phage head-tail adaptor
MVAIGQYKERVQIYARTLTKDSLGQQVPSYSLLYTLWAKYIPGGGGESFEANEKTARNYAEFQVRYQGISLNEAQRLVWTNAGTTFDFNITSIDMNGFKEYYSIKCLAKDNA